MKTINYSLLWLSAIMFFSVVADVDAKKCKTVDSLVVKCALSVCGKINGASMGELLAYASVVNSTNGTTLVGTGEDVPFTDDTVPPFNMSHDAGTFTSITVNQAGIYSIFYKVRSSANVAETQIYLNGAPVVGTDDSGNTTTLRVCLVQANAGDVVTLRNIGAPFLLATGPFTTQPACFVIVRIA